MFKRFRSERTKHGGSADHTRQPANPQTRSASTEKGVPSSWPTQSTFGSQDLPLRSSATALSGLDYSATLVASSAFNSPIRHPASVNTPALAPPRNAQGLNLIHDPQDSTADIIFVHGLGGSSWNTWCWRHDPSMFWPAWLQDEQGFSHFRVFTFGYNADWRGPETKLSLLDFAKGLLVRMRGYGDEESSGNKPIGKRPIIFVAHSMGGLVVKKAYVLGKYDEHFTDMISHVHGIIFLSTPHRGSSLASSLNNLLSAMVGTSSKVYVSELISNSTSIEDLNELFRTLCGPLRLVSMYETLPTKLSPFVKKLIIGKDTGILNYPSEISGPANADHHTICKYHSRVDDNYLLFVAFLKQISRDLVHHSVSAPSLTKQPTPVDRTRMLELILSIAESPTQDLEKYASQGLQGSGEWLRRRESFVHWLSGSGDGTRLFCLSGMPGAGKSTLAAMTIHHLQNVFLGQSCQYHFFVESQPIKRSLAYCLRSIAFQIANTHDMFAERLARLHQDVGDALSSQNPQAIWGKLFEGVLFKLDIGYTLHWVLDGVDEAENSQALLKFLSHMETSSPIKVMLLSRPSKDLTRAVTQRAKAAVFDTITVQDTAEDIREYVRSVITEILPEESRMQGEVVEQISSRTEGSFLWARLTLDRLHLNWHTLGDMQKAMDIIPKDMQSLYRNMLHGVKTQDIQLQEMARRILTWVTCGFRPIKLAELEAALEPEFGRFISLKNTIIQICGHFVRVDGDNVSLIHATARRFLMTPDGDEPGLVPSHSGHEMLAKACLSYLSDDRWRRILSQVPEGDTERKDRLAAIYDSHPLLSYAMNYWSYHLRHAPVNSPDLLQHLKRFFSKHVLCWIQAVALSRSLHILPLTSQYIKLYLKRRKRGQPSSLASAKENDEGRPGENGVSFLEQWSIDLIRLLGKFGNNLAEAPSSIFKHISPFCPRDSVIAQFGARQENPFIKVSGISARTWDDNLARLSVGQDETVSKVRCTGAYIVALVSLHGTLVVWSAETCEELLRLEHEEWVTLFEINGTGNMVVSSGRLTFKIWDISTGQLLHSFEKNRQLPMQVAFGAADTDLVVAYDDCSIVRYDTGTGTEAERFEAEESDKLRGCPQLMVLSPDQTQVAIAFRGQPVVVWDVDSASLNPPRRCLRAADELRSPNRESDEWDTYCDPEAAVWHPDGDSLFIMYHDTVIMHWNVIEDERSEHDKTEAREMAINSDGTLLLTSNFSGALSVWALPRFNLVYRLHGEDLDLVRDVAFSPDSQRIYDARGPLCCVWEPDALIRQGDIDQHGDHLTETVDWDESTALEAPFEPVYSQTGGGSEVITALTYQSGGEFYCCGRRDGTVAIHDMNKGKITRKVCTHGLHAEVINLAWSASGKYLASADDMGRVIVKRLKSKEDGKFAVFPVFETRIDDAVAEQFLFSPDERRLLISARSGDQIWDLAAKTRVSERTRLGKLVGQWLNHPYDGTRLLFVETNRVHIHEWQNFTDEGVTIHNTTTIGAADDTDEVTLAGTETADSEYKVQALSATNNRHFLVYHACPELWKRRRADKNQLGVFLATDLQTPAPTPQEARVRYQPLPALSAQTQRFLGCYRDKIAFIDHQNWLCTSTISWDGKVPPKTTRHFFLARDWLGTESAAQLIRFTEQGVLLVPRDGEVAIVRYARGF